MSDVDTCDCGNLNWCLLELYLIIFHNSHLILNMSYTGSGGSGQTVYVIDTGISHSHNDYGGRASYHWDYTNGVSIKLEYAVSLCSN